MSGHVDEETLLLARNGKKQATPLPWFQFSIALFLQLAEPLTSHVIYPFVPQLIRDIGITNGNESKVGYYVGLMQPLFFLTQAFTLSNFLGTSVQSQLKWRIEWKHWGHQKVLLCTYL